MTAVRFFSVFNKFKQEEANEMNRYTVLLILFGSFLFCSIQIALFAQTRDQNPSTDLEKIQGKWQMVLRERGGELSEIGAIFTIVEGRNFRTIDGSGKVLDSGAITLGEQEKPKTYDATITSTKDGHENTYLGIYRLQADTWQTCVNGDASGSRPARFISEPGSKLQMIVWRRVGSLSDIPADKTK